MTEIICTAITAMATVICAYLAHQTRRAERRAEQRKRESLLHLQLQNANCALTVGVAMALKNGKCNGEVEAGLVEVKTARDAYTTFLSETGIEQIVG